MSDRKKISADIVWATAFAAAFVKQWVQSTDDADIDGGTVDVDGVVAWAIDIADRAVSGLSAHADENGVEVIE
jgi:hypothetical protein